MTFRTQESPRLRRGLYRIADKLSVGVAPASVWWGVLGHRLVDFFAALGPGFGALLTLLVQLVLGAQEFDEGLFGSVAFLEAGADDAEVAAGAVSVTRGYGVKQAGDGFPGLQIGKGQAAGMQVRVTDLHPDALLI
jgi:hypothetical protein